MTKEIITTHRQHGFVYDMVSIKFDEKICQNMLAEELTPESKREFLHAAYVNCFVQKATLISKTSYGQCDVTFSPSIIHIKNYIADIYAKTKGKITQSDIDTYIPIIEKILNISGKEQEVSTQIVVPYLKTTLGITS
jgi:hypothetical protein